MTKMLYNYKKLPVLTVIIAWCWINSCAADVLVFYGFDGTMHNFENPAAIAIKYEYDGPTPLKEALTRFFNGPSEAEIGDTGAVRVIECAKSNVGKSSKNHCEADEIFFSVNLVNGTAFIELKGVPYTPTNGQWTIFATPLGLTVKQFPGVSDFKFVVMGREVEVLDWANGCNRVCFWVPETAQELDEILENN